MNFNKNEEAKESLKSALGKGVQTVINLASKLLGNPIVLIDLAYTLLNFTENVVTDDPLWNELVTKGKFSHQTVDFFKSEKFIEVFAMSEHVAILKSDKLKYNRASAPVFNLIDEQIGSICVVECYKSFTSEDYELIQLLAEQLSIELCNKNQEFKAVQTAQEAAISALIEGNGSELKHKKTLSMLYKGLKKNIYIAVIDIIQYDSSLTHLAYFRDLFKSIKSDFDYYIYLNNIVAIISTDQPIIGVKRELRVLNDFFARYKIYAGISESFSDITGLREYFKEALHALNFGMEMNYGKNIFMFADFRLEAFIKDNSEKVAKLCHPVVYYIDSYDAENNTKFKDHLYTYLLAGRCAERASKMSGISLAEFTKTLTLIEELFEIDFTNMNTVFGMFCSMKLQEYFPEKRQKQLKKHNN